jgi:uncharacterized protein (DUF1800 family)
MPLLPWWEDSCPLATPTTGTHIASKLVRHFIADTPPRPPVDRLARTFLDTSGDLKEVTSALVSSAEAWALPRTKLKRPSEWVVSMVRGRGHTSCACGI